MEVTIHSRRMTRQASMLEHLATGGTALALPSGSCGDFSVPNRPISGEPEEAGKPLFSFSYLGRSASR
jgi:hypothetical protein